MHAHQPRPSDKMQDSEEAWHERCQAGDATTSEEHAYLSTGKQRCSVGGTVKQGTEGGEIWERNGKEGKTDDDTKRLTFSLPLALTAKRRHNARLPGDKTHGERREPDES